MIYLTNAVEIPEQYDELYGLLVLPVHLNHTNTIDNITSDKKWLLDNHAFSGKFNTEAWLRFMIEWKDYKKNCIGVSVPDVVGDCLKTIQNFSKYHQIVRDLGYPVAFVSQDGITPEIAPWDYLDTLFIGGTDDHKLGHETISMIVEAQRREKWVHVGRVNSESRIKQFWMANSVDGTYFINRKRLIKGETKNDRDIRLLDDFRRISIAIEFCRNKKNGKLKSNGQYQLEIK